MRKRHGYYIWAYSAMLTKQSVPNKSRKLTQETVTATDTYGGKSITAMAHRHEQSASGHALAALRARKPKMEHRNEYTKSKGGT